MYTGSSVNVTASATGLVAPDICTVTVAGGKETDAGTYTAAALALSNSCYQLPDGVTHAYTIAKAPITFVVTDHTQDYNGETKLAAVAQTKGEMPAIAKDKFTVSYEQSGKIVTNPTDVGEYDVMVEITDNNFKHKNESDNKRKIRVGTLTLNRALYPPFADKTMTWPSAESLIYGQLLTDSTLTGGNQTDQGIYTWTKPEVRPTVTNSGYLVTFTPTDTNYSSVQQTVEITVEPKELTIAGAVAQNREYIPENTKTAVSGGSLQGVESGDDVVLDETGAGGEILTPDVADNKEVTVTGYTITGTEAENYTLTQPVGLTVNITPAEGSGSVTMAGWTYGDTAADPVPVSATNGVENVSYSYAGIDTAGAAYASSGIRPTAAGSYTVTAVYPATNNYKVVTATAAFTIAKRPLTLEWSNLYHNYDGSAASPVVQPVNRAIGDGDAQCGVALTGVQSNVNAGRYTITAILTGTAAASYTLPAKNTEILVIRPAPVTVSVTGYSHKKDGSPKEASVIITPNVEHTVTYRLAGREIAAPTEAGQYDIIVGLGNTNYRFEDGVDGKPRKMGVLTIYENKPPQTYTIQFESGAEDAKGTPPELPASVEGTIHLLPDNTFTRTGFAFAGWKSENEVYQPQERFIQPANNNTVFTAQWKKSTFDLGGLVDQDGKPLANVRVVLMRGAEQVADTFTDQQGRYTFTGVLSGLYNLVAVKPVENGDMIQTIKIEVTSADVDKANITMPLGMANSIVEVIPGTPKIIVGNLEQIFREVDGTVYTEDDRQTVQNGGIVEIRFLAGQKEEEELDETEIQELAAAAGNAKIKLYLALDIQKITTRPKDPNTPGILPTVDMTAVPDSGILLEIFIPLPRELQGRQDYSIMRMHENESSAITDTPNGYGEFFTVNAGAVLALHWWIFGQFPCWCLQYWQCGAYSLDVSGKMIWI